MDRNDVKVKEYMAAQKTEREYLVAKKVLVGELMKVIDPEKKEIHDCLKMLDDMYRSCYTILPDNTRMYLCDENIEIQIIAQNIIRSIGLCEKEG